MQNNQRKGIMLILSSPSGAGKTSICKKVLETDKNLVMSVSYTTRPKRKSEKEGKDYIFVKKKNLTIYNRKTSLLKVLLFLIIFMELQKTLLKKILAKEKIFYLISTGRVHRNW